MLVSESQARSSIRGRRVLVGVSLVVAVAVCALVAGFVVGQLGGAAHAAHDDGPSGTDYAAIASAPLAPAVPAAVPGASTGSFTENCGSDADGRHRNPDNVIAQPDQPGQAHHVHDYAGNLSTNAFSTNASLAAAATTCPDGDKSTYFWPVLRLLGQTGSDDNEIGGGLDGNHGRVITASSAVIRFTGNAVTNVVPMPEFLRVASGDPKPLTDGLAAQADPIWTCTGYENRETRAYPLCPAGSDVVRIFRFPSCWNGTSLDSPTHATQVVAAAANGVCPHATFAVPQLTLTLTYHVPPGVMYAIDSFPEQQRSPLSDHADFIDVMPADLQSKVVHCINNGQNC